MQGEEVRELLKNKKSQEKFREFCGVKFIFRQSGHSNFEIFCRRRMLPDPPSLKVLDTHKNLIVVYKSQRISSLLETGQIETSHVNFENLSGLRWDRNPRPSAYLTTA